MVPCMWYNIIYINLKTQIKQYYIVFIYIYMEIWKDSCNIYDSYCF